jgi:hypothetical protein
MINLKALGWYVRRQKAWGQETWEHYRLRQGGKHSLGATWKHWSSPVKKYITTAGPDLYMRKRAK